MVGRRRPIGGSGPSAGTTGTRAGAKTRGRQTSEGEEARPVDTYAEAGSRSSSATRVVGQGSRLSIETLVANCRGPGDPAIEQKYEAVVQWVEACDRPSAAEVGLALPIIGFKAMKARNTERASNDPLATRAATLLDQFVGRDLPGFGIGEIDAALGPAMRVITEDFLECRYTDVGQRAWGEQLWNQVVPLLPRATVVTLLRARDAVVYHRAVTMLPAIEAELARRPRAERWAALGDVMPAARQELLAGGTADSFHPDQSRAALCRYYAADESLHPTTAEDAAALLPVFLGAVGHWDPPVSLGRVVVQLAAQAGFAPDPVPDALVAARVANVPLDCDEATAAALSAWLTSPALTAGQATGVLEAWCERWSRSHASAPSIGAARIMLGLLTRCGVSDRLRRSLDTAISSHQLDRVSPEVRNALVTGLSTLPALASHPRLALLRELGLTSADEGAVGVWELVLPYLRYRDHDQYVASLDLRDFYRWLIGGGDRLRQWYRNLKAWRPDVGTRSALATVAGQERPAMSPDPMYRALLLTPEAITGPEAERMVKTLGPAEIPIVQRALRRAQIAIDDDVATAWAAVGPRLTSVYVGLIFDAAGIDASSDPADVRRFLEDLSPFGRAVHYLALARWVGACEVRVDDAYSSFAAPVADPTPLMSGVLSTDDPALDFFSDLLTATDYPRARFDSDSDWRTGYAIRTKAFEYLALTTDEHPSSVDGFIEWLAAGEAASEYRSSDSNARLLISRRQQRRAEALGLPLLRSVLDQVARDNPVYAVLQEFAEALGDRRPAVVPLALTRPIHAVDDETKFLDAGDEPAIRRPVNYDKLNAVRAAVMGGLLAAGWVRDTVPTDAQLRAALRSQRDGHWLPPLVSLSGDAHPARLFLNGHHRTSAFITLVADGIIPEAALDVFTVEECAVTTDAIIARAANEGTVTLLTWFDVLHFHPRSLAMMARLGWLLE